MLPQAGRRDAAGLRPAERIAAAVRPRVAGRFHWEDLRMKTTMKALLGAAGMLAVGLGLGAGTTPAMAQGKTITLCWAAWDPANALVELSKDFTAKTGIDMKFEFVPWTNYADRFLNELNSQGKLCDLLIGDCQWIGGAAENGHYVKLNDFFDKEGIKMDDFMPATVVGYSEWPKNTPNYWALPAMGDAVGWTYRKDWFSKPELQGRIQGEVRPRPRRRRRPRRAEADRRVLPGPRDRRQEGLWRRRSTPSAARKASPWASPNVLYHYGFEYQNPKKPYDMEGFVNSADAVKGLEFYKALYECCTPPGSSNVYMQEGLDAFKSGQVAMQMNFRLLARASTRTRMSAATRSASSSIPAENGPFRAARRPGHLGGLLLRQPGRRAAIHQVVRLRPTCRRSGGRSAAIPAPSRC